MNNKLSLVVLAIVALIPSLANAQLPADIDPQGSSACVVIDNNLRYRSTDAGTNSEVSVLQDYLQANSYLNSNPTGFFGLMTFAAVKKFQAAHSISPTGYVGPLTRAMIKSLSCGGTRTTNITTPTPPLPPPNIAQPTLAITSPSEGSSYKSGDMINIKWTSIGIPSDAVLSIRLKSYLDSKEYHFPPYPAKSINDGMEALVIPPGIPVGAYYLEMKTEVNGQTFLFSSSNYLKIIDAPVSSEYVKCVFNNSNREEECHTTDGTYSFSGVGTAGGEVRGPYGARQMWKSTCGGDYAHTAIDGNNEYASFYCGTSMY